MARIEAAHWQVLFHNHYSRWHPSSSLGFVVLSSTAQEPVANPLPSPKVTARDDIPALSPINLEPPLIVRGVRVSPTARRPSELQVGPKSNELERLQV